MNYRRHLPVIALLCLGSCLLATTTVRSAEITLRAKCQASGVMVTLGDVAEVVAADEATQQALEQLELVPAPAAGRSRSLRIHEVQDLIALQGVKLPDHKFSGASSIQIFSGGKLTSTSEKVSSHVAEQSRARVERAIREHLQANAGERLWQVSFELEAADIETVAAHRISEVSAAGGKRPWTGVQQFQVDLRTSQGVQRIPVTAEVSLPEMVVVSRRPFRRGEVVQASDVELVMPTVATEHSQLATRLEDVVGHETTRSIATGQSFEATWLRKPIMVRRGEVVTIFARAANVQVRTQARALEDGGRDDIVSVERLDDRQRFTARVSGVQELEVFVSSTSVADRRQR
jgi:flagellar basal body P-ring formation protein FlgA